MRQENSPRPLRVYIFTMCVEEAMSSFLVKIDYNLQKIKPFIYNLYTLFKWF